VKAAGMLARGKERQSPLRDSASITRASPARSGLFDCARESIAPDVRRLVVGTGFTGNLVLLAYRVDSRVVTGCESGEHDARNLTRAVAPAHIDSLPTQPTCGNQARPTDFSFHPITTGSGTAYRVGIRRSCVPAPCAPVSHTRRHSSPSDTVCNVYDQRHLPRSNHGPRATTEHEKHAIPVEPRGESAKADFAVLGATSVAGRAGHRGGDYQPDGDPLGQGSHPRT